MTGLLLAGTYEARQLAERLAERGISCQASLAGETREPAKLAIQTRVGGFGGRQGFREYIKNIESKWVIDATHPFAVKMSDTAYHICKERDVPYLRLERPAWDVAQFAHWHSFAAIRDVEPVLATASRVFIATGRNTIKEYCDFTVDGLFCRVIDAPYEPFPFENGRYVVGRPPFSVEAEIALFEELAIDWLVLKNSGGSGGYSKLIAAEKLGVNVALIERPRLSYTAPCVETVEAALDWLAQYA